MNSRTSDHGIAIVASAGLAGLALLAFAIGGSQQQTVVGRAWPVPWSGLALPWWIVGILLPAIMPVLVMLGRARSGSRPAHRMATCMALVLAVLGVLAIWAVHLPRHDRALTALHAAVVLSLVGLAVSGRRARWVVILASGAVLATLSYGAIWGEARCDEPGELVCLVDRGPRVIVPKLFDAFGVPVFAVLPGADLRGADLSGRDLRLANLRGAQLDGAVLASANLRRARLEQVRALGSIWSGAFLAGASLHGAQLSGADLRGVDAYRVDLRGADLRDADARGASLSHAQLDGARLDGVRAQGAYLRFATGWSDAQLSVMHRDAGTRLPD
jgi:hypothetical protein